MKKFTLSLCFFLLLLLSCSKDDTFPEESSTEPVIENPRQSPSLDPWTSYCGWHYNNGCIPQWGGWAREYVKSRFGLFITDPNTYTLDPSKLDENFLGLQDLSTEIDALQLVGGLGSAKDTTRVIEWMNFIESDNGQKWKDIVYEQSLKLTELADAQARVYWQIGNEISSPSYSKTLRYWQGQPFGNGKNYDTFIIPYYVENFLAPTVEAIDKASLEVYGEKGKINICLGSLTNASSLKAQMFLDELLNYEITGTNAPSLSGNKVSDLIHIITIHYTAGTAPSANWEGILDHYKDYTGTGRIKGVWSTEEVGINAAMGGAGSTIGSLATFRYLEWGINNGYSAKEIRTNYFGWASGDPKSTVNTFNQFLFDFLGKSKLSNIPQASTIIHSNNTTEHHSFITEDESKKILAVFTERIQPPLTAQISSIKLDKEDWKYGDVNNVYLYNKDGINPVSYHINNSSSEVEIAFDSPIELDFYSGLMVLLE